MALDSAPGNAYFAKVGDETLAKKRSGSARGALTASHGSRRGSEGTGAASPGAALRPAYGPDLRQALLRGPLLGAPWPTPAVAVQRQDAQEPPSSSELEWQGSTDAELDFMRRVFEIHQQRSAADREFVASIPDDELGTIEGSFRMRIEAAPSALALLTAARAALLEAQQAGDPAALASEGIGIASAYRTVEQQFNLWERYFHNDPENYFANTQARRAEEFGDPLSDEAARWLARRIGGRIASPGYSKHQDGWALDLRVEQDGEAYETSNPDGWRTTWLWQWLLLHAGDFGFEQNESIDEPWHWEFQH